MIMNQVAPVAAPVDVPVVEAPVVQSRRSPRPEPEVATESASAPAAASAAVESKPRPARRRRSRGGRGGGSRPRSVTAEPATAEASVAQASVAESVVAGKLPTGAAPVQAASAPPAPAREPLFLRSGCRDRARVRGSSGIIFIRFRVICCANFFSMTRRSSAFRIWCFQICDRC